MAYEFEQGFDWIYPVKGSLLKSGEPVQLRWQGNPASTSGKIEYSPIGTDKWYPVATTVEACAITTTWTPPDTTILARVRLVTDENTYLSDTFAISRPVPLQVGFACEDDLLLHWNQLPEAKQYQLFRLGDYYMEPFMVTTDTAALLPGERNQARYYAVAPLIGNVAIGRSLTIDPKKAEYGCYIKSFLPRQLVTDSIFMDLRIATQYGLTSASLQRWTPQGYQTVQQITPVTALEMLFTDPQPKTGHNLYRIRLENEAGKVYYSQTEEVYYLRAGEMLVFPNPLLAGQLLNIVEGEDKPAIIYLYDSRGALLHQFRETGTIKTFDTTQLRKGTYLIRIQTESGKYVSEKIVIF